PRAEARGGAAFVANDLWLACEYAPPVGEAACGQVVTSTASTTLSVTSTTSTSTSTSSTLPVTSTTMSTTLSVTSTTSTTLPPTFTCAPSWGTTVHALCQVISFMTLLVPGSPTST